MLAEVECWGKDELAGKAVPERVDAVRAGTYGLAIFTSGLGVYFFVVDVLGLY
jgi:hypothetical protein